MWYLGLAIGAICVIISGAAKGLKCRVFVKHETPPKFMSGGFWDITTPDIPADRWYSVLANFFGFSNGYKLLEGAHWMLLSIGSMLLSISMFFYANTLSGFVHIHCIILFSIFLFRKLGKLLTE